MKKVLLSAIGFLLSSSALFAQNLAPANYDFTKATALPIHTVGYHQNTTSSKVFANGLPETYQNGLIVLSGNGYGQADGENGNLAAFNSLKNGMSLVNLGGTIGQVLCVASMGSDVETALTELAGRTIEIPAKMTQTFTAWFALNFMTQDIPAGRYKIAVEMNMYSNKDTGKILNSIYTMDKFGNVVPTGANAGGNIIVNASDFYTDGKWDGTKWMRYEFETSFGAGILPFHVKFDFPNSSLNGNGNALFIRNVSITPSNENSAIVANNRNKEYITLNPGEITAVEGINADSNSIALQVNGNSVEFNTEVSVLNLLGATIAQGRSAELPAGIYVATNGTSSVKFVVK